MTKYAIGLDFGTNSARALLVDIETHVELSISVWNYPNQEVGLVLVPDEDPADWLTMEIPHIKDGAGKTQSHHDSSYNCWSGRIYVAPRFWKELYLYAHLLMGPRHHEVQPQDLVQEALTRVLEGVRRWKREKVPFIHFMKGVVRSLVSHQKKRDSRITFCIDLDRPQNGSHKGEARSSGLPDEEVEAPDQVIEKTETEEEVLQALEDDPVARSIAEVVLFGTGTGRRAIISTLNISAPEFDAAIRRMRRKILRIHSLEAKRP